MDVKRLALALSAYMKDRMDEEKARKSRRSESTYQYG